MSSKGLLINLFWKFVERISSQGISFLVTIILARLVEPYTYGILAIINVLIALMNVFIDGGLGNSLIQKKDADNNDFTSVFYFNIGFSIFLYAIIYIIAPYIAAIYDNYELIILIRVSGVTLLASGIRNVLNAYIAKYMLFKKLFLVSLISTLGSAVIGISMAYLGYGVWALVFQNIFSIFIGTISLWCSIKWRPFAFFSFKRLKELMSFGWKLLVVSLLETTYNNVYQLIIGKKYSTLDLAYLNKGKQFPDLIVTNINSSIKSVLFPAMSIEQDNINKIKQMTRQAITTSVYVMAPILIGLAAIADRLVVVVLTEKWANCAIYLQIFCISYLFQPIQTANKSTLKSMGKGGIYLKIEVITIMFGIVAVIFASFISVKAVAICVVIVALFEQVMLALPNKRILNYGYLDQIKDILPSLVMALSMGLIVYLLSYIKANDIIILLIQVVIGTVIYISESALFKNKTFLNLMKKYKSLKH